LQARSLLSSDVKHQDGVTIIAISIMGIKEICECFSVVVI